MSNEHEKTANSLEKYLAWVARECSGYCAFRGQENAEWSLKCGAAARLNGVDSDASCEGEQLNEKLVDYHKVALIKPARQLGFASENGKELGDLEILAKLQHLGAATFLLDFTRESLIALWFSCQLNETDGKVFVIDTADKEKFRELKPSQAEGKDNLRDYLLLDSAEKSWYWNPPMVKGIAPRILVQHSLFVFGRPVLLEDTVKSVTIPKEKKECILEDLKTKHGLYKESLFPDVYGFADANKRKSSIGQRIRTSRDYICSGIEAYNKGDYQEAIQDFTEAVYFQPRKASIYFMRGNSRVELGLLPDDLQQYRDAIGDYDLAINNIGQKASQEELLLVPAILFGAGNARAALAKWDEAVRDYTRCIDIEPGTSRFEPGTSRLYGEAYYNRANVFFMKRCWGRAKDDYEKAIPRLQVLENADFFRAAHFNLGNTCVMQENYSGAVENYDEALKVDRLFNHASQNSEAAQALNGEQVTGSLDFVGNVGNMGMIELLGLEARLGLEAGKGFPGYSGFSKGNLNVS